MQRSWISQDWSKCRSPVFGRRIKKLVVPKYKSWARLSSTTKLETNFLFARPLNSPLLDFCRLSNGPVRVMVVAMAQQRTTVAGGAIGVDSAAIRYRAAAILSHHGGVEIYQARTTNCG